MNRLSKHIEYIFKYPGIIPRAVNNYWRMLVLRQKRLRGIEFALNWECQCRCRHCSALRFKETALSDDRPRLTTAQIIGSIHQCLDLGAMNINLTGGESLLREDLADIVRASRPKSAVVSVATNGILLTGEKAAMLAAAGVRIVTISLDSADAETHDRIRGVPGCFEKALAAAEHAKREGIEVFFCTILSRDNIVNGDIHRLVALSREMGTMLTVNLPCRVGSWAEDDVLLREDELEVHRKLLEEPNVRWEGLSNYLKPGCPAGVEKLYISPSGDVMPCPFIHIRYGNLAEEPLTAIWNRILSESPFNRIHSHCLAAEDPEFVESVAGPSAGSTSYPIEPCGHEPSTPGPGRRDDPEEAG